MNPLDVPSVSLLLSFHEFAAALGAVNCVLELCEKDVWSHILGDPDGNAMKSLRCLQAKLNAIYQQRTAPSERH